MHGTENISMWMVHTLYKRKTVYNSREKYIQVFKKPVIFLYTVGFCPIMQNTFGTEDSRGIVKDEGRTGANIIVFNISSYPVFFIRKINFRLHENTEFLTVVYSKGVW